MKGIILAGGLGSRLNPISLGISKQLMPIYDKPMIYYPLSVLMLAGIREILIITTPGDRDAFERLLGRGSNLGLKISYETQHQPDGIASAFVLGESFLNGDDVALILGDNIFYGPNLSGKLKNAVTRVKDERKASVFGYQVKDPSRFGVVEFDVNNHAISIEEKPSNPRSNFAVTGLYFYDNAVVSIAKDLKPSPRGELEITDVNKNYLSQGLLHVEKLSRGYAWLDTGTCSSLLSASNFVQTVQNRQGFYIACLEEIAINQGWISEEKVAAQIKGMGSNDYKYYLEKLIQG